ncbi:MAG: right-handed parallel beta-helix repeat-containing protein [Bryobacterales bacterium]|nr:right-handed parallel beta-helix repeat-containing protein [Bryobacterales bacterium]
MTVLIESVPRYQEFSHLLVLAALATLCVPASMARQAGLPSTATYYVSSSAGRDEADGLSPKTAWRSLERVNTAAIQPGDRILFKRGNLWRGQLFPKSGAAGRPVTYGAYGKGARPILQASVAKDGPDAWYSAGNNLWTTRPPKGPNEVQENLSRAAARPGSGEELDVDVGNIIFDHGPLCGVKKWRREDLLQDGDYWYDAAATQVWLYSRKPPTTRHRSIELALKKHIIDQRGARYVIFEDLHLRYGAAHGIGGGDTGNITVRRCDVSFIGGGHQLTRPDGKPVRFGNGIEFWGAARSNLVEQCRVWEIYDAALTNQGNSSSSEQVDIIYRDNVIWNAEYSFEYWNRPAEARTENIVFEHNTCVDAGGGWGHNQRPDRNGRHLMFYSNTAATRGFVVRNNIFYDSTDSGLRMDTDWRAGMTLDYNLWFQKTGPLFSFLRRNFAADQLAAYRTASGLDAHSVVAKPRFRNAARRDYRLAPGSPGFKWTTEGQPCGAVPRR